jgi:hypothetical protein
MKNRTLRGLAAVAVLAAATVLSACSSTGGVAAAVPHSKANPDKEWASKAAQYKGTLSEIADEAQSVSTAAGNVDIVGAAVHARAGADLFTYLLGKWSALPETNGSALGRDAVTGLTQCERAWDHAATAFEDVDTSGMESAGSEIRTCTGNVTSLATRIGELS